MIYILGVFSAVALIWLMKQITGFWAQRPHHYANDAPRFDIKAHLNGRIRVDGVIYGPFGRVVSRFTAVMQCKWQDEIGEIREVFTYASGEVQHRHWRLSEDEGQVIAKADDIIGEAIGAQSGSALSLSYRIRLPKEAGGHVLTARDWMYLLPNGVMINRNEMRKFGIKVAELVAILTPEAEDVKP